MLHCLAEAVEKSVCGSIPPPVRAKEETCEERSREYKWWVMLWVHMRSDKQRRRRQGTEKRHLPVMRVMNAMSQRNNLSNDAAAA